MFVFREEDKVTIVKHQLEAVIKRYKDNNWGITL